MQIVDVLRDHGRRLAGAVEACEREVAAAGPRCRKLRIHGEPPPPGLVAHLLAGATNSSNGNRPVLGPQPAGRAEIRNAALGRNAGAGERGDDARAFDQLLQLVDGGLQIGRDHVCFLVRFLARRCQGGHTMRYLHTMLRVRNLDARARFLLQQARAQGGAPPGRREEPLHPRLPGRAGGRGARRGEQARPAATLRWSSSPIIGTARITARRAISATSPTRSMTSMPYATS